MTNAQSHRSRIISNVKAALSIVIIFAVIELVIIVTQSYRQLEQRDLNTNYHLQSIELLSNMNNELAEIRFLKATNTVTLTIEEDQYLRDSIRSIFLIEQALTELKQTEIAYGKGDFTETLTELERDASPLFELLELQNSTMPFQTVINDVVLETLSVKILQLKRLHINANNILVDESDRNAKLSVIFVISIGVIALITSFIMIRKFLKSIRHSLNLQKQYEIQLAEEKDALFKQEAENREILSFVIEGVITIDEQGNILSSNKAAEEMFGYSKEEIISQNIRQLMPESIANEDNQYQQNHFSSNIEKIIDNPLQLSGMHRENSAFPILLTVVELPSTNDQQRRFICSCQDLTLIKTQEEQIRRTQKMDALGKLTGGIAHDYNNMLAIISGYASLLSQKYADHDGILSYSHEIEKACSRGAKLTRKLLSFSKRSSSDTELVSINESLRQMQDMLEKTLTARIRLNLRLERNLPLVELSISELEDAVLNVCINSMHAIEDHGSIDILTRAVTHHDEGFVEIDFIDDGFGMEQAVVDKVFDPFFSTKGDEGTGLGLSQVHGFVERHNGSIKVESAPGKGSRFTFTFPVAISPPVEQPPIEPGLKRSKQLTGDILVVDDEPQLVEYLTTILEINGFTVYQANSAVEALGVLREHEIDLVITDVVMPGMNGFELCQKIEELYPRTKVQLVSGYAGKVSSSLISEEILEALIEKPYDEATLINRVQCLLE